MNEMNPVMQKQAARITRQTSILVLGLALTGCGTISNVKTASGEKKLNVSGYNKVLVQDFTVKTNAQGSTEKQPVKGVQMKEVAQSFASCIAQEIERRGDFSSVSRTDPADELTLLITGEITRYEEGSAAARFWVGMRAGNSYFDAVIEFREGATGKVLGRMTVDKNSWVLGGGLASTQTPQMFMVEAAKKVANQLHDAKAARQTAPQTASSK